MDPTTCFLTILDYIRSIEYSEARTYAAILQAWLNNRGFYPEGHTPERVDQVLAELLKPACAPNAIRTRFQSLTCYECDDTQADLRGRTWTGAGRLEHGVPSPQCRG